MAESKVNLDDRKMRLVMQSDTLRYQVGLQCEELAAPAELFLQGIQAAQLGSRLYAATTPLRQRKRNKLLSLPAVIWRLWRG